MTDSQLVLAGLIAFALILLTTGTIATIIRIRPQRIKRPQWDRMLAETDYYRKAMHHLFRERGYKVTGWAVMKDATEREPRELVFSLRKRDVLYCAYCVRWMVPVTSDVIERFEKALGTTRAQRGLIVTTSTYTPAAFNRAEGLPVELFMRDDLRKWISQV